MSSAGLLYFANRSRTATNSPTSIPSQPATGTVQASSTSVISTLKNPYLPGVGTLVLDDPLRDNSHNCRLAYKFAFSFLSRGFRL